MNLEKRTRPPKIQAIEQMAMEVTSQGVSRRRFMQLGAGLMAASMTPRLWANSPYRVGVGTGIDPYSTTTNAIDASGEWPAVGGKLVVIKPNLVIGQVAESGIVTDPHVVRAAVDRALQDGAALILIVETSPVGAHFQDTGYGIFQNYDIANRVHLVDLQDLTSVFAPNPSGWLYKQIYMANLLQIPEPVFINTAKLKTHWETTVSLTAKNLFGIPDLSRYTSPRISPGRFAMHDRGVNQTIVDLNLLRPSTFSIIDGIWGHEGPGPVFGTPIFSGTVLAGKNSLAVDRVGLELMEVPQQAVRHLNYLSLFGFGPSDLGEISIVGDPLKPRMYQIPTLPPEVSLPAISPATLDLTAQSTVSINVAFLTPCSRKIEIVRVYDDRADVELIRTLQPEAFRTPGVDTLRWDGRSDDGNLVEPATYGVRATAFNLNALERPTAASSWVEVV